MIFSIPIIAIVTSHYRKQTKIKHEILRDEIELEKIKHENYIIETEKIKLKIEQMRPLNLTKQESTLHVKK